MRRYGWIAAMAMTGLLSGASAAQQPVDSSVQASPIKAPAPAPAIDSSVQASPVTVGPNTVPPPHIAAGTAIRLRLERAANSAQMKNGDTLPAVLTAPVQVRGGKSLLAGTKVAVSVEETIPAGKIQSAGEFTLQVVKVGTVTVVTEPQEFEGRPGHKDLPDSAPDKGTEATLPAGATLTFHVQATPKM
jgi:hypothetical protein